MGEVRVPGLVRSLLAVICSEARHVVAYLAGGASIEAGKHALNLIVHIVFFLRRVEGGNVDRQSRVGLAGVLPFFDCYIYIIAQRNEVVKNFLFQ